MFWTPVVAVAILVVFLTIGDYVALKTKGYVSSVVIALFFLILGGTLKILPPDLIDMTGFAPLAGSIVMPLILVNVGTVIDINSLKSEWKTVIISIAGIIGIVAINFTVGTALFGQEYAYAASAPISGGAVLL